MSDNHALKIIGIGTTKIKMYDDIICIIQKVRHVAGLKKNLLSLGQLDDFSCKTCIEKEVLKIIKGVLVVLKVEKTPFSIRVLQPRSSNCPKNNRFFFKPAMCRTP